MSETNPNLSQEITKQDSVPVVCTWCGSDSTDGYHGPVRLEEAVRCKRKGAGPLVSLCFDCDLKREETWTRSELMIALDCICDALGIQHGIHPDDRARFAMLKIRSNRNELRDARREVVNLRRWNSDTEARRANERGILCDEIAARQRAEASSRILREALSELMDPPQGTDIRDRITKGRFAMEVTKEWGA